MKSLPLTLCTSILLALSATGISLADDGPIFRRDVSKTPDLETGHAAFRMLPLYVPAQTSAGDLDLDGIPYYNLDSTENPVEIRFEARPLITHYSDGHVEGIEVDGYGGFPGHGNRDAIGAVSLDDGTTWKTTNLSKSGDLSSIKVRDGRRRVAYPGDVGRSFMASDGNKVLVVWVSRYARGGNPNYAMPLEELEALAPILQERGTIPDAGPCIDEDLFTPCLYLEDHFGVSGSQGVSDMADEGLPLIGELPYAAVWAARGVMLPPEQTGLETSRFVWFKAERLSSAVRDANRPEAKCVKGAGCAVTWQEDPDGMRPGEGEGPGEGWSGAVAHHGTDIWYSYIRWDDFDLVVGEEGYGSFYEDSGELALWVADNLDSGSPQAAIPMAIPVRLTDNQMCVALVGDETDKPYCHIDFDGSGTLDFCASTVTVSIETPEGGGTEVEMCVTEDGRLMRGNTASTRARLGLHGYSTLGVYDPDSPSTFPIDGAWFYMAYEENKGLGECDDEGTKLDMGKNIWYHTFDMTKPELVSQGLMLNQPAVYPDDFSDPLGVLTQDTSLGYNFYQVTDDPIYEVQAGIDTTLYQAEISRRSSPISQDWYDRGESGTVALQLWKQGIVRRGGPADVFGRRFVMPVGDAETLFKWCEDSGTFEWCRTVFDYCTGDCEANTPNDLFGDLNKGQCKKNPEDPRCFEYYYIDENGDTIYTHDPQNCPEEPVCYTDMASCPPGEDCQENTLCESIASCPADLGVDGTCVAEKICYTDSECPDDGTVCEEISTGGVDHTLNPYDYTNMECGTWAFTDGSNPRYVKGFCADPAINLSASSILEGESCTGALGCFDVFPFNEYFDDIDMSLATDGISKITTWVQYGLNHGETPSTTDHTLFDEVSSFDDFSWENPYDVAKGHRGFMAGDMVMVMYAASANWMALTMGHAPFNLYNRRSFDGGNTWTTLPGSFTHTNDITYSGKGTATCENMGVIGTETQYPVCTAYGAGDFEQARNVSQLLGFQVTVLDPRYAPTSRSITEDSVSSDSLPSGFIAPLYDDDVRDPSRYFMVYETGHTSAYDAGEAEPLDLFYSRAVEWGDQYLVWQDEESYVGECLPDADSEVDLLGFCNEFDALEGHHDLESGEASVAASPGGQFFYSVWNEGELAGDEVISSDAIFRRVLFLDDYEPPLEEPTP